MPLVLLLELQSTCSENNFSEQVAIKLNLNELKIKETKIQVKCQRGERIIFQNSIKLLINLCRLFRFRLL